MTEHLALADKHFSRFLHLKEKDEPDYNPYCMRCPGIWGTRMVKKERGWWTHRCGASHDARADLKLLDLEEKHKVKGQRLPLTPEGFFPEDTAAGDYGRIERTLEQVHGIERQLWWNVWAPDGSSVTLNPEIHTVVEHEDRTITVTPSIVTPTWHGWLTRGFWLSVEDVK